MKVEVNSDTPPFLTNYHRIFTMPVLVAIAPCFLPTLGRLPHKQSAAPLRFDDPLADRVADQFRA
jgi:hypothetical protein